MTNSPVSDEAQVGDPVVAVQAGVGEKEAEVMSGETEDQKRIEEVAEALENRLRANPIQQPNGKLSGWKAAGIIAAVLTAIATPVLTSHGSCPARCSRWTVRVPRSRTSTRI
jgi:hypothetical protein